jgi:predicted ATP-dependent serine protease
LDKNENKKINFSVAIITFNEEANIKDCIESVDKWADEIIVLDSMRQTGQSRLQSLFPG